MESLKLFIKTKDEYYKGNILGWDYYIDTNNKVYSISKDGNKKGNSYFGDIRHTLNCVVKDNEEVKIGLEYKDIIEDVISNYATSNEEETFGNIVTYISSQSNKEYKYYFRLRPPSLGTHPRSGLIKLYSDTVKYNNRSYWGYALYNRELTSQELNDYDLDNAI